jgi:Tol biopolymer transport system component/predicted Ser/Thr protein kinase
MTLASGTKLGPYEITGAIGAGGMGEVYRAKDTRLDRIIAIKVLPDHLASRAELRERFEREARTVASLNHPHICVLHDIGQQDGTDFLVMEYLEGETLAERLKKGPLPLDQVLQYAIEISDALDKAHRKGITHRDLKPGNIMLTKSGTKLLDFGLAKLRGPQVAVANLSALPTEGSNLTAQGTILGTLQYMAPEQVEGREVDARTDIFAFGVVAYEMATGKKAFEGKTSASVMAKILEVDPPPMSSLQPMTPPALDRVVKRCLAKEPDERWQSASDLTHELKWIAGGGAQTVVPGAATAERARLLRRWALVAGLASLIVAVITSVVTWNLKPSAPAAPNPVTRLTVALPPGSELGVSSVAFSPDGRQLVYEGRNGGGVLQLYVRSMDSLEGKLISGTEGALMPFFSPDGQWVGFFAEGKLKKVPITGGSSPVLCDALNPGGGSWAPNDTIFFSDGPLPTLWQVSAKGGTAESVTKLDRQKGEISHRWPQILPGGKAVLFTVWTGPGADEKQVQLQMLGSGERRVLVQGGHTGYYVGAGHLVYSRRGTLMAVPFDLARLEVASSAPVAVAEGVEDAGEGAQYTISGNGSLAYVPGGYLFDTRLIWVDRSGKLEPLAAPPRPYSYPRISPDGQQVALTISGAKDDLWLYNFARGTLVRLTSEGSSQAPTWAPDGKRLAYRATRAGSRNIFWRAVDGTGAEERLTIGEGLQTPSSWSPDGKMLAYADESGTTGAAGVSVLSIEREREARPFLQTRFDELAPVFSPNGRWLAYVSDESGRNEIYVRPFPGPGEKFPISNEGGIEPLWARNGRELFYRAADKMMVVGVQTEPSFRAGAPRVLFQGRFAGAIGRQAGYDISPDGQRFLMLKPSESAEAAPTQINVVLNWFEELKQKVPAGKK